jgi:NAD(P)-dependent dehydrogenase (short-subunit alcohol dehydrogenase family)
MTSTDPETTTDEQAARPPMGTVLVTGAASGLGAAVVTAVRSAGGTAVAIDRVPMADVDHEVVDLVDGRAAEAAVDRLLHRHPDLRGVVCAAGTDACGRLDDVDADAWERVVLVNLLGTAAVVRAALPALRRNTGRVVTVASTLGLRAVSDATAYCASKFGVVGFTRALATEAAGEVGVTLLIPGGMATAFFDGRTEQYKPPADAKLNDPSDVAAAAVFALSQPAGCEVRELVIAPSLDSSYP